MAKDVSIVDDNNPVTENLSFFDIVGRNDDCISSPHLQYGVPNITFCVRIEARSGFVQDEQFGAADNCHGEGDFAFHPVGDLFRHVLDFGVDIEVLEHQAGFFFGIDVAGSTKLKKHFQKPAFSSGRSLGSFEIPTMKNGFENRSRCFQDFLEAEAWKTKRGLQVIENSHCSSRTIMSRPEET